MSINVENCQIMCIDKALSRRIHGHIYGHKSSGFHKTSVDTIVPYIYENNGLIAQFWTSLDALGSRIICLTGTYWDFFDHYLPLTELSVAELMSLSGFEIERSVARFLPYTMSLGYQPAVWKVRLFLKCPFVWRFFGRQFLVIGKKPEATT